MTFQSLISSIRNALSQSRKSHLALYAALILALVNGIIYMIIIPPWQHNDEPNHFEYAWLVANRSGLPKFGDYDFTLHQVIARSMIEHNFFANMGFLPDLNSKDKPAWIGAYDQTKDPPVYYLLASLPLRLLRIGGPYQNIEWQYRSVQIVSLLLFLLTVLFAWGLVRELTGEANPLVWIVPICMALEPSFTGVMTSINNDVGAIAFFTGFLWGAVYLIRRGFSWKGFAWSTAGAVICYFTNSIVYIAVPLLLVAVLLSLVPTPRRWWFWAALGAMAVMALFVIFAWGDAAGWYRLSLQDEPTRSQSNSAPLGKYVFQLVSHGNETSPSSIAIQQLISPDDFTAFSGQTVTLGAWIWSNRAVSICGPILKSNMLDSPILQTIQITKKPIFFVFTVALPTDTSQLQVVLSPLVNAPLPNTSIYYDGLVLLKGQWPGDQPPQFTDAQGQAGVWGGASFTNLLRNGSAESGWPHIRSWADRAGARFLPDNGRPSLVLYALLEIRDLRKYYLSVIINLVRTFWAKFGWEKVSLLGGTPYRYLSYLMGIGFIGAFLALWRARKEVPWHPLIFLGLATLGVWISTFFMGTVYLFIGYFYPHSRYSFTVMVLVLLLLANGWLGWIPDKYRKYFEAAIPVGFLLLNIYAVISIYLSYLWE
jgi:hypothetical protein